MMDVSVPDQETVLLRRRSTLTRWESFRWTIGLSWDRASSTLAVYPVPCVALYVHLPGRRTRTGVTRWFRTRAVLIVAASVATVIAIGGFCVGRWSSSSRTIAAPLSAVSLCPAHEHPRPVIVEPSVVASSFAIPSSMPSAEQPVLPQLPHAVSSTRRLAVPSSSSKIPLTIDRGF